MNTNIPAMLLIVYGQVQAIETPSTTCQTLWQPGFLAMLLTIDGSMVKFKTMVLGMLPTMYGKVRSGQLYII